ncbi:hypothetical protein BKA67DRAFT_570930 [Truncatella angustata]|uniref:Uncharacterized protein n=1 Tax=Truncatella angustata TaxID=152316 RepID=A0A9P8UG04_9PEZI|nr:uncharacterized protein BKA67DRAFT_570930 [Truncatella angustata]KAH6651433.1 hypothetical protein BKA67DRAFT_570930 [Truncatella angustata]KAH8194551.1 hypothetical protein TruAng_011286 [Truncatella angustata]
MASQRVLATPPSQDAILNSFLEDVRAFNKRSPHSYVGMRECPFDAEMPLLLNPPSEPVACREPLALFEAVNAHFSAQVHALFNALHGFEDAANKQSSDELDFIRPDEGLWLAIRLINQSYDIYPDCFHRTFHTRRLTVQNLDSLPLLQHVTQLRIFSAPNYAFEPMLSTAHMRPVSPRVPLELAARLPHLRELDCPWLWESLPIAFSSQALRRLLRVWEGPWRDSRAEFGRGLRHLMPLLPSTLTKARLWFWKPNPRGDDTDQAAQMPNLVGASSSSSSTSEFEGMDPVSLGLRSLGSRLEELDIRALITPNLFHDGGDNSVTASSLSWPYMQHLKVEFHPCAPDGGWYFSGPRNEDPHPIGFAVTREEHYPPGQEDIDETHELLSREEDEFTGEDEMYLDRLPDMFRTLPIKERINPLLLAFASSIQRQNMPTLRDAELFAWLTWQPSEERTQEYEGSDDAPASAEDGAVLFRWGVRYNAPIGDGKGKVTWQVGEDWRPSDEIMRAFEHLVGVDSENMEWEAFEFVEERELDPLVFIL